MIYRYRAAGCEIESELELPTLPPCDEPRAAAAEIVVALGPVAEGLVNPDHMSPLFQTQGRRRYLVSIPRVGRLLVEDGCRITIDLENDPADVRPFLAGSVQAVLWHQRGLLPLHASVVSIAGCAVALAGPSASGKSTLAAVLARQGHAVIADDIGIVDLRDKRPVVLPGSPFLLLWRDAVDFLGLPLAGLTRHLAHREQYLVANPAPFRDRPLDLCAVVLLSRRASGAPTIERLHGYQAARPLLRHVHASRAARALGHEAAVFAAVTMVAARVAIFQLKVPDDLACLAPAAALIYRALAEGR
jgi:energy-coupling factor transporter ATP-binding protein EcfA2